jgi:hypothetical protein
MGEGSMRTIGILLVLSWSACACAPGASGRDDRATKEVMPPNSESVPDHLKRFPGLSIRSGDRIVPAPEADVAVAKTYATSPEKGAWVDGRRVTILTSALQVKADQPIRVIHVVESTRSGDALHVMGPKPVLGELVDGKLMTAAAPASGDPLAPSGAYDGRVQSAPAVDYNYDITEYRLPVGRHVIEWQLGPLRSNQLVIDVVD